MLFEGPGVGNIFEEILENFFERTEVSAYYLSTKERIVFDNEYLNS